MKTRLTAYEIKDAISPVDFYLFEIASMPRPERDGWADGGLCPIHCDRTSDVFRVNTHTGAFKCSKCEAKGNDIIEFTMQCHDMGFDQTLKSLAYQYGMLHGC